MKITEELKELAEVFKSKGKRLYIVGGSVRDSLLGLGTEEIDYNLCSSVTPRELIDLLEGSRFIPEIINGKMGIMAIVGYKKYEHSTFRKDIYDSQTHKQISTSFVSSLEEDAKRRDFKINAIYYDIFNDKIIDPFDGKNDIKNSVLSTTRNPRIIYEDDPERILRAIRLSTILQFRIPDSEMEILKANFKNINLIPKEKIKSEFEKMLKLDKYYLNFEKGKNAHFKALKQLGEFGLWKYFLPSLEEWQNLAVFTEKGVKYYDFILEEMKHTNKDLRLCSIMENLTKAELQRRQLKESDFNELFLEIVDKNLGKDSLNYSKEEIENVKKIIFGADFMCGLFTTNAKLRGFIFDNRFVIDEILKLKKTRKYDEKKQKKHLKTIELLKSEYESMKAEGYPFHIDELKIYGEELIRAFPRIKLDKLDDFREGILRRLVVQKRYNNKDELIILGTKEIESNLEYYTE